MEDERYSGRWHGTVYEKRRNIWQRRRKSEIPRWSFNSILFDNDDFSGLFIEYDMMRLSRLKCLKGDKRNVKRENSSAWCNRLHCCL